MASPARILVVKTGALGDVLRTTSILPGLAARHAEQGLEVTWITAPAARDLVSGHPRIDRVLCVKPKDAAAVEALAEELAAEAPFDRVLSLDDEEPLCALAARVGGDPAEGRLSGAYLDAGGTRRYTPDVAPWFDMGLLSVHGKQEADRLKVANDRSHAAIYAEMFGVAMGEPELDLPAEVRARGAARLAAARAQAAAAMEGRDPSCVIGLNTGSGGRWHSKALAPERVVELAVELDRRLSASRKRRPLFVLLGGPEERERNADLAARLAAQVLAFDAGTDNAMLDFAAVVDGLDLLVTSDSLALHIAVARHVSVVAFFAPTSAAEIELYGRGEKVASTAPDYCSYRPDADTSTLTVDRLLAAVLRVLGDV